MEAIQISVKEVEEKISSYEKELKMKIEKFLINKDFFRMQGELSVYKHLLENKKIQMSKKNINFEHDFRLI